MNGKLIDHYIPIDGVEKPIDLGWGIAVAHGQYADQIRSILSSLSRVSRPVYPFKFQHSEFRGVEDARTAWTGWTGSDRDRRQSGVLIILAGIPGVGKTTIARQLAGRIGAVRVRVDSIEQALREGGVGALDDVGYRVG